MCEAEVGTQSAVHRKMGPGGGGGASRQGKLGWDLKEWGSHEQANKCSFYRASGSGYLEMMEEEGGCLGTDSPKRDKG